MDNEKNSEIKPTNEKPRIITLSPKMYKYGIASLVIGTLLLLGTGSYSVYSYMHYKSNNESVAKMEQSTKLQQEQLLTLSKKAAALNEELQNLTQMESELRLQAGLKPAKESDKKTSEGENANESSAESENNSNKNEENNNPTEQGKSSNGQGGPINELTMADLNESLTMLETDIKLRRESLEELQTELKTQREQMAVIVSIQSAAANSASAISGQIANTPISQNAFAFGTASVSSNMPSIWPTTGVVTSPYGLRWGGSDFHPGIDIANDMGTPIVATADGIVVVAGWNSGGYGNMVDIDHGNGIMTRYGHASQVVVSAGQHVKRGQVIALMGSTGFSTGPHVHYEVHVNGQRVNPISYL